MHGTVTGLASLALLAWLWPYFGLTESGLNLAAVAFTYSIVAAGIAFLYDYGGLLSVAHGSLWGMGAYFAAILCQQHGWSLLPAAGMAVAAAAAAAALLSVLSVRLRGSYFVIVLFAVSEVVEGIMINWVPVTGGNEGIVVSTPPSLFGHVIDSTMSWYAITAVTLIVVLLMLQVARKSSLGRQLRAIRDNRELAVSVGIRVGRVHMIAFALSGVFAGLGGVYWAFLQGYVVPSQYSPLAGITFLVIMLLGGSGYLLGSTIGAVVVIFLPQSLNLSPLMADAVIGAVFIVVILLSPRGIAGLLVSGFRRVTRTREGDQRLLAGQSRPAMPDADGSGADSKASLA